MFRKDNKTEMLKKMMARDRFYADRSVDLYTDIIKVLENLKNRRFNKDKSGRYTREGVNTAKSELLAMRNRYAQAYKTVKTQYENL